MEGRSGKLIFLSREVFYSLFFLVFQFQRGQEFFLWIFLLLEIGLKLYTDKKVEIIIFVEKIFLYPVISSSGKYLIINDDRVFYKIYISRRERKIITNDYQLRVYCQSVSIPVTNTYINIVYFTKFPSQTRKFRRVSDLRKLHSREQLRGQKLFAPSRRGNGK